MAEIKMTRIDARLVHGQVAGRWIKTCNAQRVIIIGDEVANDPFMVKMFIMLSPPGTNIICYTVEQAVKEWQKDKFGEGNVIILFKDVNSADKAWRSGVKYEHLNLGQVPSAANRKLAYATVCLSLEEIDMLDALANEGVDIYFQAIPDDKQQPLEPISKKLRSKF